MDENDRLNDKYYRKLSKVAFEARSNLPMGDFVPLMARLFTGIYIFECLGSTKEEFIEDFGDLLDSVLGDAGKMWERCMKPDESE